MSTLSIFETFPRTADGWSLHLKRTTSETHFDPAKRPVVLLPGYGMNAFILGFHPGGVSFERALAEAGHEVWSANLRGQGRSRSMSKSAERASMRTLVDIDVATAVDVALRQTQTQSQAVDLVGCSLGGTLAYAFLARHSDANVGSVVAIGSPLRWLDVPLYFKLVFASPALAGAVPIKGVRWGAKQIAPLVRFAPKLLHAYGNTAHIDLDALVEMANTVEDPSPLVNRDMAEWFQSGDLHIEGRNVTHGLSQVQHPLLVVTANRDGIVPSSSARSALHHWGGRDVQELVVGTDEDWYAHADLFVGHASPTKVFAPIVDFLASR